jgi:hypothetical protein
MQQIKLALDDYTQQDSHEDLNIIHNLQSTNCSQLVADILIHYGALQSSRSSLHFMPCDFSSANMCSTLNLNDGYSFSPDLRIPMRDRVIESSDSLVTIKPIEANDIQARVDPCSFATGDVLSLSPGIIEINVLSGRLHILNAAGRVIEEVSAVGDDKHSKRYIVIDTEEDLVYLKAYQQSSVEVRLKDALSTSEDMITAVSHHNKMSSFLCRELMATAAMAMSDSQEFIHVSLLAVFSFVYHSSNANIEICVFYRVIHLHVRWRFIKLESSFLP